MEYIVKKLVPPKMSDQKKNGGGGMWLFIYHSEHNITNFLLIMQVLEKSLYISC